MTKARDLGDNAQNTKPKVINAKGDLIVGTGSDAADRLAVSDNGSTLVADSSASTGLRWQGNFAAGKNKIINGDFGIWQRGTSFTPTVEVYTADRWVYGSDLGSGGVISQQTFTPGSAPVAGYEGQYFLRYVRSSGTTTYNFIRQPIEDVRTFAGQNVVISFWAKADAARTISVSFLQIFGTGGSSPVDIGVTGNGDLTTSWQRLTFTASVPSISGKTIGTNSNLRLQINYGTGNRTIDIWGVQVEAGNVATAFQTATGTLAGELSACMRYYQRISQSTNTRFLTGVFTAVSTTIAQGAFPLFVPLRDTPTVADFANISLTPDNIGSAFAISAFAKSAQSEGGSAVIINATSTGLTQYRPYLIYGSSANSYIGVGAEL